MKTITPQLPTIAGSSAAMLIAFLSLMNGTSPGTCMMKALAAFLVFAGFGLVLRFALSEELAKDEDGLSAFPALPPTQATGQLDMILPGTSVADLLGAHDVDIALQETEDAAA